jgi:hypothetical protein
VTSSETKPLGTTAARAEGGRDARRQEKRAAQQRIGKRSEGLFLQGKRRSPHETEAPLLIRDGTIVLPPFESREREGRMIRPREGG